MPEDIIEGEPSEPVVEPAEPVEPVEKVVPYHRFQEVNQKMRDLEQEVSALKTQKQDTGLTPEQQKELEAKQYLSKLIVEQLETRTKTEKDAETQEQRKFESEVSDVLAINSDVKRTEFLKFIEDEADKYGVKSVEGAMLLYRRISEVSKETAEKTKKELASKPGFPKSQGGGGATDYAEADKGKSLRQIASDVIKGLTK